MDLSRPPNSYSEAMAIQAAAAYSIDCISAVIEYCRLIGIEYSHELHDELQTKMLALLPPYRHPTADEFSEYMIFIDPDCFGGSLTGYQVPSFLKELQKVVGEKLFNEIAEYTKEAESNKITTAKYKSEAQEVAARLESAKRGYCDNNDRADARNCQVAQTLGFSTGVPSKRIDYKLAYKSYVYLVRKSGKSREDAIVQIKKEYGFNSRDATIKALYKYREIMLEKWEQDCPTLLHKIKDQLKGLIPPRR